MRLIDADALKPDYIVGSTSTNTECYRYVSIGQIMNTPTADIAEVPRWIPVTERLPEYGDKVLVTFRNKYIDRTTIGVSRCYVQEEGFFSDQPFDYAAVAWMPLPAPWKGEKNWILEKELDGSE